MHLTLAEIAELETELRQAKAVIAQIESELRSHKLQKAPPATVKRLAEVKAGLQKARTVTRR